LPYKRKKQIKKKIEKQLKTKINSMVKTIKASSKFSLWSLCQDFIDKIGPSPVSSRPYWQRINRLRRGKNKSSIIPDLKFKDKKYDTDFDKANLFKDILKDKFKLNEDDSFSLS